MEQKPFDYSTVRVAGDCEDDEFDLLLNNAGNIASSNGLTEDKLNMLLKDEE